MAFNIDYTGKTVLVTGASSGIGLGTARQFARAGANVVGCSRKPDGDPHSETFRKAVEDEGAKALYVQADVTNEADLRNLVAKAVEVFGGIDVLVSNAGVNVFGGVDCDADMWAYNIELNLASHWRLAKLCKPYLEKSGEGVILIMTSNHAYSSIPGCFPYNVTKTALTGLVRSMAMEWTPAIRTVGIAPGFIDTAGNDSWFQSFPDPAAERQRTIDLHPVKCLGTPEQVGALCVYLASREAGFICGTTILMDGGRSTLMQDS